MEILILIALIFIVGFTAVAGVYLHKILKTLDTLSPGDRVKFFETRAQREIRVTKPKPKK